MTVRNNMQLGTRLVCDASLSSVIVGSTNDRECTEAKASAKVFHAGLTDNSVSFNAMGEPAGL